MEPPIVDEGSTAWDEDARVVPNAAPDDRQAERLVADVMVIQRRFGHAIRNAQSDRRDQIREAIERAVGSSH